MAALVLPHATIAAFQPASYCFRIFAIIQNESRVLYSIDSIDLQPRTADVQPDIRSILIQRYFASATEMMGSNHLVHFMWTSKAPFSNESQSLNL